MQLSLLSVLSIVTNNLLNKTCQSKTENKMHTERKNFDILFKGGWNLCLYDSL